MNNSLESSKFFPYVAWTVVVLFALFTYSLTMRLQSELSNINNGIDRLEQKINNLETQPRATTTTPVTAKEKYSY